MAYEDAQGRSTEAVGQMVERIRDGTLVSVSPGLSGRPPFQRMTSPLSLQPRAPSYKHASYAEWMIGRPLRSSTLRKSARLFRPIILAALGRTRQTRTTVSIRVRDLALLMSRPMDAPFEDVISHVRCRSQARAAAHGLVPCAAPAWNPESVARLRRLSWTSRSEPKCSGQRSNRLVARTSFGKIT